MSFDEKLFQTVWKYFKTRRQSREEKVRITDAKLSDVSSRLSLLASAYSGKIFEIKSVETFGYASPHCLYLPSSMDMATEICSNEDIYIYRLIHDITHMNLWVGRQTQGLKFATNVFSRRLAVLFDLISVESTMNRETPGLFQRWQQLKPKLQIARPREEPEYEGDLWSMMVYCYLNDSKFWIEFPKLESLGSPFQARNYLEFERFAKSLKLKSDKRHSYWPKFWGIYLPDETLSLSDTTPHNKSMLPTGTEKKAKVKEKVKRTELEQSDDWNPVTHVLESVKTADNYDGSKRMVDGSDALNDHLDALEELDLNEVVRSPEQVSSVYQADLNLVSTELADEIDPVGLIQEFFYDEWNGRSNSYRKNWCKLTVVNSVNTQSEDNLKALEDANRLLKLDKDLIRLLQKKVHAIVLDRRWRTRQPEGENVDIEAIVERASLLKSGRGDLHRLYVKKQRYDKKIATQILLDASLSTDSWVHDRRVLDLSKRAVLILAEVLSALELKIAVAAFNSFTRKDCRLTKIKDFNTTWDSAKPALMQLAPAGYTRMGPAIRHGCFELTQVTATKKVLLVISDGKPTDYDIYEGRYGIEDVRRAVLEARSQGITVYNITIDKSSKAQFSHMFGHRYFQIVHDPVVLPQVLTNLYTKLI